MKLTKITLFIALIFTPFAFASRVAEVEQFYITRVTEILKTRFPEKPFTAFVNVDTGRDEFSRRQNRREEKKTRLPFLEVDEAEMEVWDRTDIPLGTLISQVRAIDIDIRIDASLSNDEIEELKTNLIKQLKLDERSDKIQITRMKWTDPDRYRTFEWVGGAIAVAIIVLVFLFWFVARLSVRTLVKGLTRPIQEIGRNTKQFAQKALNLTSDLASPGPSKDVEKINNETSSQENIKLGDNLLEMRQAALQILERNMQIFEHPDARLMDILERKGSEEPAVIGSILAELKDEALKQLFRYGWGNWWFTAVALPGPLTPKSMGILSEVDRLRLRRNFFSDDSQGDKEIRESALILCRLNQYELAEVFKDVPIEKAQPILDLLPRSTGLAVAKGIFPGQWALFVQSNRKAEALDPNLLKFLVQRASEMKPLRDDAEVRAFFMDLDFATYLDSASPRDERDFYTVLPVNSRIVMERVPFFQVFDSATDVQKALGPLLTVKDWALVLYNCDGNERDKLMSHFSERLRFQINEAMGQLVPLELDLVRMQKLRRQLVKVCVEYSEKIAENNIDIPASTPVEESGNQAA